MVLRCIAGEGIPQRRCGRHHDLHPAQRALVSRSDFLSWHRALVFVPPQESVADKCPLLPTSVLFCSTNILCSDWGTEEKISEDEETFDTAI